MSKKMEVFEVSMGMESGLGFILRQKRMKGQGPTMYVVGKWEVEKMHRECRVLCEEGFHFEAMYGFWSLEEALEIVEGKEIEIDQSWEVVLI